MEKGIADTVWGGGFHDEEGAIVSNARHKALLDKALKSMLYVKELLKAKASPEITAVELKEAIFDLGLVIGVSVSEDILDRIFSEFCIGK